MKTFIACVAVAYLIGALGTFWLHTQMPVTFGVALVRSFLWPAWVLTGWPHGAPMPMD